MYYNGAFVQPLLRGKAMSIIYPVVYVSGMQCACIVLLSVVCPAVQYFSTLSHKRKDFREKKLLIQNACFAFLHNFRPKLFYF